MSGTDVLRKNQEALARITSAIPEERRHEVAADLRLLVTVVAFVESMLRGKEAMETSAKDVRSPEGPPVEQPQPPASPGPENPPVPGASLPPGPMTPQRRRQ